MSDQENGPGGRLPQLAPSDLTGAQKEVYDEINGSLLEMARKAGFVGELADGRFVGPFNPFLYSPDVSKGFIAFQQAEEKHTTLDNRVRQVVILSVGAVWAAKYELYAHIAVARKAGLEEQAIQALADGRTPEGLTVEEDIAHRFTRQLTLEHRVGADLYQQARQQFGEAGLVNMVYLIGAYLFTCALLNAFEIPVPEEAA